MPDLVSFWIIHSLQFFAYRPFVIVRQMATKQAERIQGFIGLLSRVSWLIDDWGL